MTRVTSNDRVNLTAESTRLRRSYSIPSLRSAAGSPWRYVADY